MYLSFYGGQMPTVFTNKGKDAVMTLASSGSLCLRAPVRKKAHMSASGSPFHKLCGWKWRGAL
jgi:hypothetical protein